MNHLNHQDLQSLLSALADLYADFDRKTLPQRTTEAVAKIIPNEIVSFDAFGTDDKYRFMAWNNGDGMLTPEVLEGFAAFAHQHPLIPIALEKNIQKVVTMTDYVSLSEFERTDLYNEFFRRIGHKYQMGIALPTAPDLTFSCGMNRAKKDFSGRDKLILKLIAPHLVNTIRNAFAFERLQSVIEAQSTGVIAIDADGKTQYVSEFASELLRKYFADEKLKDNSLPESLRDWAKRQNSANKKEFDLPPSPFKIKNTVGELTARLMHNSTTQEKTLLLEERKLFCPKVLEQLNLTKRETEILFWMAQGKTDIETGKILYISPRTVHKHTEHIYVKLGVETRTAAMLRALEIPA